MQTEFILYKDLKIFIKRKPRQKRLYLYVKPGGLILVSAAKSTSSPMIKSFVAKNEPWLKKSLDKMQNVVPAEVIQICDGAMVLFMGSSYKLSVQKSGKNNVFIDQAAAEKIICMESRKTDPTSLKKQLREFYKTSAENLYQELVQKLSRHLNLKISRVRVANQRSRWGSCSSAGVISLNLKLMAAPVDSIIYVVIHEVCHLIHPNHGPGFWKQVEKLMPHYQVHEKWLKDHARDLDFLND